MLRLYLRFYLALVASLALFGLAAALLLHFADGPMQQVGVTVGRLVENALPPAQAPALEQQQALRRLAAGLNADVTLFSSDGTVIVAIGRPLPMPAAPNYHLLSFWHWRGGTVSGVRLPDGRLLVASVPIGFSVSRLNFHFLLLVAAVGIGLAAYPIVRQLTARLERLQRAVDSLGAGDLQARVAVEGHDEIAGLAASFNRAASQIEQLILANRSLLANASHELRTPLARIRLAVEMLKQSADPKTKAGLEQDIAELDGLVDEILLASRLNAVPQDGVREEIDLLALAAEECARYDDVLLEGAPIKVQGDPRLLRRLLRNLLENAKRHGVAPTQVRLRREAGIAEVKVWDNGPGPDRAEFELLFTPFYRRRDSPNSTGAGLGLSLVRQIARRHGGNARCATMDDGRSCFIVTLVSADSA
ncbi:MAG TPA: HAMP domain-containing sensor histidine kinase [Steroidobacteraceae bacterium]|jgi:signal transduction histidine kinase